MKYRVVTSNLNEDIFKILHKYPEINMRFQVSTIRERCEFFEDEIMANLYIDVETMEDIERLIDITGHSVVVKLKGDKRILTIYDGYLE